MPSSHRVRRRGPRIPMVTSLLVSIQLLVVWTLVTAHRQDVVELVYEPALRVADALTPDELQVRGNVGLGFAWILGAALAYALVGAATFAALRSVLTRAGRSGSRSRPDR